jgi:Zn-dependent protease with chaperone function
VSLSVGFVSVIETYIALSKTAEVDEDFVSIILLSFIPWIALGLTGVLLALMSMRLESMVANARRAERAIQVFDSSKELFHGVHLIVLPLEAPVAFAQRINGVGKIIVSSKTKSLLTVDEFDAVLMHELQHLKRKHLVLKQGTARLSSWLPWFFFTTMIHSELHYLLELDADMAAGKKIDLKHLNHARSKFVECL